MDERQKMELSPESEKESNAPLWEMWLRVEKYCEKLKEWYESRDYYHQIGFLIHTGTAEDNTLRELLEFSESSERSEFDNELKRRIVKRLNCNKSDLLEMTYNNNKRALSTLLLLFNVESLRKSSNTDERYSFLRHKEEKWSLEHIHALSSEGLDPRDRSAWKNWLDTHESVLRKMKPNNQQLRQDYDKAIADIEALNKNTMTYQTFLMVQKRVVGFFTEPDNEGKEDGGDMQRITNPHGIGNMALLGADKNSALNNAVFEVKRQKIIKMDKAGETIPVCTKRVFLKYYNKDDITSVQHYYWGVTDRKCYVEAIEDVLADYFSKQESNESEEFDNV